MTNIPETIEPYKYESLGDIREAHARLLDILDQKFDKSASQIDEAGAILTMESEIRGFLEAGAASGYCLDVIEDRIACQALLDYWVSNLVRAGLEIDKVHLALFDPEQLPILPDEPYPYVGLKAFEEKENYIFFGRAADIEAIAEKIREVPLVAVLGASGSGKSSLVMGGVIPYLKKTNEIKFRYIPPFTPGNAALFHLVSAVRSLGSGIEKSIESDVQRLLEDPSYMVELISDEDLRPALIVIDQFEELFTLSENSGDIAHFAKCLTCVLDNQNGHRIILTVREEFNDQLVVLTELENYLKPGTRYFMRPMGYEDLRGAIEGPANLVNLQFQPGIVDDIVQKVLGQPAVLPLLQFTLRCLWEKRNRNRITWEIYKDVCDYQAEDKPYGPLQALSRSADDFYNHFAEEDQDEIRRILLEMILVNELLEAYRQPVIENQLLAAGKANTTRVLKFLAQADYINIKPGATPRERIIEIKHESLIRNWKRLVDWIAEKRESLKQRLAITQAAKRWADVGRPTEGLLTGWQLQYAKQITGFSDLELEYIEASEEAINQEQARKEKKRKRKFFLLKVLMIASILIVGCLWAWDHFFWQEYKKTWGILDELTQLSPEDREKFTENRLDNLAIYLWKRNDKDAIKKLLDILFKADQRGLFEPEFYPVSTWQAMEEGIQGISSKQESSIVSLHIPQKIPVHVGLMQKLWRDFVKIEWEYNIPIPASLNVVQSNDDVSLMQLKIEQWGIPDSQKKDDLSSINRRDSQLKTLAKTSVPIATVETEKTEQLIDINSFVQRIKTFSLPIKDYDKRTIFIHDSKFKDSPDIKILFFNFANTNGVGKDIKSIGDGWLQVPRWIIPLLKVADIKDYYPPETILLFDILDKLRTKQKFYSDGFISLLIAYQSLSTPNTVEMACQAVGGWQNLIASIKERFIEKERPVTHLFYELENVADSAMHSASTGSVNCRNELLVTQAKKIEIIDFNRQVYESLQGAYKQMENQIQVHFSQDLWPIITQENQLSKDVQRRHDDLRLRLLQENGYYKLPSVKFVPDKAMPPHHFTIEFFPKVVSLKFEAKPDRELDDIFQELERSGCLMGLCIDLEEAARLRAELPQDLQQWLSSKNFDLVKLKWLLRETLVKGSSNRVNDDTSMDEAPPASAGLVHFSWQMRSLVFWVNVCSPSDYACLGEGLRKTQQARLMLKSEAENSQKIPTEIPGIEALIHGKLTQAGDVFQRWLAKTNRIDAEDKFVQAYSKVVPSIEYLAFNEVCNPVPGKFRDQEYLVNTAGMPEKINEFMADYQESLLSDHKRRMTLCQISSELAQGNEIERWKKTVETLLTENDNWSREERYWLYYLALKTHLKSDDSKFKAPPPHLEKISTFLLSALTSFPERQADLSFDELLKLCNEPNAGAWCLDMLRPIPRVKKNSHWIPYQLAYELSQRNRKSAKDALTLLNQARRNLYHLEKGLRETQLAYLTYTRGLANYTLGSFGNRENYLLAIKEFNLAAKLGSNSKSKFKPVDANYSLVQVLLNSGDLSGAEKIAQTLSDDPNDQDLLEENKISLLLQKGKFDEVFDRLKSKSDEDSLFNLSLARMLSQKPIDLDKLDNDIKQFNATSHQYRDYIRLLNYWTLVRMEKHDEAKNILIERWHDIDPSSWQVRLLPDRGDYMSVWREMLIGYFIDKVTEQDFADLLEGFEIQGDFNSSPLANAEQSRQGFLCEWFFYKALRQWTFDFDNQKLETSLNKVIDTGQIALLEYSMAKDLIKRIDNGENFKIKVDLSAP